MILENSDSLLLLARQHATNINSTFCEFQVDVAAHVKSICYKCQIEVARMSSQHATNVNSTRYEWLLDMLRISIWYATNVKLTWHECQVNDKSICYECQIKVARMSSQHAICYEYHIDMLRTSSRRATNVNTTFYECQIPWHECQANMLRMSRF